MCPVDVSAVLMAASSLVLVAMLVVQQRVISQFVIISDVWCVPCAESIHDRGATVSTQRDLLWQRGRGGCTKRPAMVGPGGATVAGLLV
jgi:hypothetical protein